MLSDELNIRASEHFWRAALHQYIASQAYCYDWLTEVNLPYIFAYFGLQHQNLYKKKIRVGSDIYNFLNQYKGVKFDKTDKKYQMLTNEEGYFLRLHLRFSNHKYIAKTGEELREYMMMYIDNWEDHSTIFEKRINFNEKRFSKIIASNSKRQDWLLRIAEDMMPEIKLGK